MFDIGFWELTVVALVGLIVIGPERLPGFVRVTGFWLGKFRRSVASVKQEIKAELYAEDLRQTMAKSAAATDLKKLIDETSEDIDNVANSVRIPELQESPIRDGADSDSPKIAAAVDDRDGSLPKNHSVKDRFSASD